MKAGAESSNLSHLIRQNLSPSPPSPRPTGHGFYLTPKYTLAKTVLSEDCDPHGG